MKDLIIRYTLCLLAVFIFIFFINITAINKRIDNIEERLKYDAYALNDSIAQSKEVEQ